MICKPLNQRKTAFLYLKTRRWCSCAVVHCGFDLIEILHSEIKRKIGFLIKVKIVFTQRVSCHL